MEEKDNLVINWFPGHMTKALRMLEVEIKNCDLVIYMLDARAPLSCLNPKFTEDTGHKPTLFILNKTDLGAGEYEGAIKMTSTLTNMRGKAVDAIERIMKDKIASAKAKGITKTVRAMVIGVPNCGKSTFINNLSGRAKTVTGDRPGVTKGKQWLAITNNLWLLDTPGTLYPKIINDQIGLNLAYIGSIRDDILPLEEIARRLLADINKLDPNALQARFNATEFDDICKKRGYVLKGGTLDIDRCAKAILTEFRAGKLGRFNLDMLLTKYSHPGYI